MLTFKLSTFNTLIRNHKEETLRLLSPLASIARGSIAGLTFLANQYHQIVVRQRTAPVNPKTVTQEQMRVSFAAASVGWKALTALNRTKWADYALTVDYPGPLGDYNITGRNIYMANLSMVHYVNARGLQVIVVNDDPPSIPGVPSWLDVNTDAPSVPGDGLSINFGNPGPEDMSYYITISPPQSPSRDRYKGPWSSGTAQSAEVASAATANVDFLTLQVGAKYFVRLKGFTTENEVRSTFEIIQSHIAETTAV